MQRAEQGFIVSHFIHVQFIWGKSENIFAIYISVVSVKCTEIEL